MQAQQSKGGTSEHVRDPYLHKDACSVLEIFLRVVHGVETVLQGSQQALRCSGFTVTISTMARTALRSSLTPCRASKQRFWRAK